MKKIKDFRRKLGISFICTAILSLFVIFFTSLDNFAFYLFFISVLGAIFCLPKNKFSMSNFQKEILTNPQHPQNPHYRSVRFYK